MLKSIQDAVPWEMPSVTPILSDLCFLSTERIIEPFSLNCCEDSLRTFTENTQSDDLYTEYSTLYIQYIYIQSIHLMVLMMTMMIGEEKLRRADMIEFKIPNDIIIFCHFLALSILFFFLMKNHMFLVSFVCVPHLLCQPALSMWQEEPRHELNDNINLIFLHSRWDVL